MPGDFSQSHSDQIERDAEDSEFREMRADEWGRIDRGGAVVARQAHNLEAEGSSPSPGTTFQRHLIDAEPLPGAYRAVIEIQRAHLMALSHGDMRGLSTVEMAILFQRASGLQDCVKALWAFVDLAERATVDADRTYEGRSIDYWLGYIGTQAKEALAKAVLP